MVAVSFPNYCERCGVEIKPGREVWLELNSVTGTWHTPEDAQVPPEQSQGCFPFGADCARAIRDGDVAFRDGFKHFDFRIVWYPAKR